MPENLMAPEWLLAEVRQAKKGQDTARAANTSHVLAQLNLSTVCDSARCPNRDDCFSHRTATFLILGDICTRNCAFCAIKKGCPPEPPREDEPERLAQAVNELGLRYVVITSVTRDDIPDGGAAHYSRVVRSLRAQSPGVSVELLVPDFRGSAKALACILENPPDILAHNLETVPRLYPRIRRDADYRRSLTLLSQAKKSSRRLITKSSLMLGLGEESREVENTLRDLRYAGCDMLTLGQYLSPSLGHAPVARYVTRQEFKQWRAKASELGFKSIAAGSLVRSSYKASIFFHNLQSDHYDAG
jgi:lipoic acid synthetase